MHDRPTAALASTRYSASQRQVLDSVDLALKLKLIDVQDAIRLSALVKAGKLDEVYQRLR